MESSSISDEKTNEIQEEYKEHIQNLSEEAIGVEKEKLIFPIQNKNGRLDINKCVDYGAVITVN